MFCRFENRLENTALVLDQLQGRIDVYHPADLSTAWQQISQAQTQGHWVALVLNYELGAHLLTLDSAVSSDTPLLSAFIMARAVHTTPWAAPEFTPALKAKAGIKKQHYLENIQRIQDGIRRGDYYQINYTIPIHIETDSAPTELYQYLAHKHPVAYGAFIDDGERAILSFSPELFVRRQADQILVKPMKGTTARHPDPIADQAAAHALQHSEKDRAENIMIVDLLRNDLSHLAVPGSVHVSKLLELEAYPSVWTMTSTIEAKVAPTTTLEQLMTALFPCGSITGTPKIAAMHCIQALEQRARGIYCGSIGWLAPTGDLQLNVAIRTIEYRSAQQAQFGVGGAIVIDSEPQLEWQECLWKARILNTPIEYED